MRLWEDKKVVIMGLGVHGGGLAAAQWFFKEGAEVIVTDMKTREVLIDSVNALDAFCRRERLARAGKKFHSIEYVLGQHREKDFETADLILQNPGVPPTSRFLNIAREKGIAIENEASLFLKLTPEAYTIGVTGTRGKSTTTSLLYAMLRAMRPGTRMGGNIATSPLFSILDTVRDKNTKTGDPVVMELSSWQLESLATSHQSPTLAIVTNIYPDHLDRHGSMEEYIAAKKNIYLFQKPGERVVLNYDNPITRALGEELGEGRVLWFSQKKSDFTEGAFVTAGHGHGGQEGEKEIHIRLHGKEERICTLEDIPLPGEHTIDNVLRAALAARWFGVPAGLIAETIATFKGVPGRLELIGYQKDRYVYNDTTATTPEATRAALQALQKHSGSLYLIAGGSHKNLDFTELGRDIAKYVAGVVLFSGTATPHLAAAIGVVGFKGPLEMANSMEEAVMKAWKMSRRDDTILLSPAAASFGMFLHEFDRGERFLQAVKAIQK